MGLHRRWQLRGANDDVINQLELENSAGFADSSSEAETRINPLVQLPVYFPFLPPFVSVRKSALV
jgi:hypothetical protein